MAVVPGEAPAFGSEVGGGWGRKRSGRGQWGRWLSPTDPKAGDAGVITDQLIQLGTKSHRAITAQLARNIGRILLDTAAAWFHPNANHGLPGSLPACFPCLSMPCGLCLFSMPVFHVARWQWQWQMPPCLSWKNVSWRKPSDRMRRWRWLEKQLCSRCNQVDPAGNRGINMTQHDWTIKKTGDKVDKWCLLDGYNMLQWLMSSEIGSFDKHHQKWLNQTGTIGWWLMVVLNDHFERTFSVDFSLIHGRLRWWNVLSHELRPGRNHGNMFSARNGALVRSENHL